MPPRLVANILPRRRMAWARATAVVLGAGVWAVVGAASAAASMLEAQVRGGAVQVSVKQVRFAL